MKVYRLLPTLLCAIPLPAQQLVTDATYSVRMTTQPNREFGISGIAGRYNVAISVGGMHPLSPKVAVGAVGTIGTWGEAYVGIGPRLSLSPSAAIAVNITPTILLYRAGEPGSSRMLLDVSVMHRERVGVSFQVTNFQQIHFTPPQGTSPAVSRTMLYGGLRLGQKPGRYGILADVVALGAAMVAVLIVCSSGDCS